MPEGLSAGEVSKEIAEHRKHAAEHGEGDEISRRRDLWISVVEALVLSVVAVLAA